MLPLNIILIILASLALLLSLVFALECLAHLFPRKVRKTPLGSRARLGILVPAHNEESVLAATLLSIQSQLRPEDRLLVVADNCTDATANVARLAAAEVTERFHDTERGKGYALAHGLQVLEQDAPEVVVFLDADCELEPGALDALAHAAMESQRPVQAVYTMGLPQEPSLKDRVSCFAFDVKNRVRADGLHRLGLPTHLTGTGMAMPWKLVSKVDFATGNLVEDMHLGLEFALKGAPPLLAPAAQVTSVLPDREDAAAQQRTRWEHGHLQTIRAQFGRLVRRGVARDPRCLALAMDLLILPLALLVMALAGIGTLALAAGCFWGAWVAASLVTTAFAALGAGVLAAWMSGGRNILSAKQLCSIPLYILWKLPVYGKFFRRGADKVWVRTERTGEKREKDLPVSLVLGHLFDNLTMDSTMEACREAMHGDKPSYFVTANFDFVARSHSDPQLKKVLFDADRILCDGMPIYWLSRAFGLGLPERVAGSDLVKHLLHECSEEGLSVFLFGCDPDTLEKLKEKLPELYPGLTIAGAISPPFGPIDSWDNASYVEAIREAKPHIVLTALGFPKQEQWINRFYKEYKAPLSIGIGASLDFIAQTQLRAPVILQRVGLEWFWRMMLSPRRLAPRYAKDIRALFYLLYIHFRALRPAPFLDSGVEITHHGISYSSAFDASLEAAIKQSESQEMPLDCSELERVDSVAISGIFRVQRLAKSEGKEVMITNAPVILRRYWKAFHLQHVLPLADPYPVDQGRERPLSGDELPQPGSILGDTTRA